MSLKIMIDTSVLGRICHPTEHSDVQEWFRSLLEQGSHVSEVLVSVLADYELRRHLLKMGAVESLRRLDDLAQCLRYVPVTAEAGRRAAELRQAMATQGMPGVSDAGLLMAAQAMIENAVLITNDRTTARIPGVQARDWTDVASR